MFLWVRAEQARRGGRDCGRRLEYERWVEWTRRWAESPGPLASSGFEGDVTCRSDDVLGSCGWSLYEGGERSNVSGRARVDIMVDTAQRESWMLRGFGFPTYVPLSYSWRITRVTCKRVTTKLSRIGVMPRHVSVEFGGGAW
jgi:hypothetical protein